jgi:protein-S-isoprenylcysteine O-methyltransferase Ste14
MKVSNRLKRFFKLRFAILYPFGVLAVIFAESSERSMNIGIGFIIAGLLMRSWANGYAIKLEKLTTSGPYAFVRHPLYLGTMLLLTGFILMLKLYWIGPVFFVMFVIAYTRTMKKEERMLEDKFKHTYLDYRKKVPAFLPAIFPYRQGDKWRFSFKRWFKSQEYKLIIWMIFLAIAFHMKDELLVEREKIDAKIVVWLVIAFLLGSADLIVEFIKKRKRKAGT